jgi:DNA polymerase-3 subunit delta'
MRLPWHTGSWQQLQNYRQTNRLPTALLLSAAAGTGIQHLAQDWLASLFCETVAVIPGDACGHCRSCTLFAAGNHPDLQIIAEVPGKTISVESVRAVLSALSQTPQIAAFRVAFIESAEKLSVSAANALLKTLEEPQGQGKWFLVSEQSWQLPATIRSRCQIIKQNPIDYEVAATWLSAQGVPRDDIAHLLDYSELRPLQALDWQRQGCVAVIHELFEQCSALQGQRAEPIAVAKAYSDYPLADVLLWIRIWLTKQLRNAVQLSPAILWQSLQYERYLTTLQHTVVNQPSVNKQLLLESILIELVRQGASHG